MSQLRCHVVICFNLILYIIENRYIRQKPKPTKMKIAIPTDDGLHVSPRCERAKGFVIAEVEKDRILHEELRWNPVPNPDDPRTSALSLINECQVVIAGDSWQNCVKLSTHSDVEVVVVKETIITNVLVEYLKDQALTASNNFCCP